jgi:hypothetical protein
MPTRRTYPWDEWLNGKAWELRRGEDYEVSTPAFRSAARQAAKRAKKRLKAWPFRNDESDGLVIQAYE